MNACCKRQLPGHLCTIYIVEVNPGLGQNQNEAKGQARAFPHQIENLKRCNMNYKTEHNYAPST